MEEKGNERERIEDKKFREKTKERGLKWEGKS